MNPATEYVHPLNISAASYWQLQQNEAFRNYLAGWEGSAITAVSREESIDTNGHKRVVRVSKIAAAALKPPAAAPRDALAQAALSFGGARRVAVLHSKRCALIELSSAEAAAQMVRHHESAPLVLGGL